MSTSEIEGMDSPKNYKKRESPMNKWLNVIFKMMLDGHSNETIYFISGSGKISQKARNN